MKSAHFSTEQEMLDWLNGLDQWNILVNQFRGIVKDETTGDWIVFYLDIELV